MYHIRGEMLPPLSYFIKSTMDTFLIYCKLSENLEKKQVGFTYPSHIV